MHAPPSFPALCKRFLGAIEYNGVNVFPYAPGANFKPQHGYFNTFPGFLAPVGPANPHLVQPILDHLHLIWCSGKEHLYTWLVNWLAFIVQFPAEKPETMLVVRSECGAGKDVFVEFFGSEFWASGQYAMGVAEGAMLGQLAVGATKALRAGPLGIVSGVMSACSCGNPK